MEPGNRSISKLFIFESGALWWMAPRKGGPKFEYPCAMDDSECNKVRQCDTQGKHDRAYTGTCKSE